jgi:hypothetical protein
MRVCLETKESALLLPTRPNNHSATFNPRYMKNLNNYIYIDRI